MKKSLIGLGVMAAMAVGGAANASFWSISNAQIDGSAVAGGPAFTIGAQSLSGAWVGGGTAQETNLLNGDNLTAVSDLVGSLLAAETLTYFSFSANSLGYFGIAFKNTTANSVTLDFNFTQLNQASEGVYMAGAPLVGYGTGSNGRFSSDDVVVASGSTLYVVMGGFATQNNPALQGAVTFNSSTAVSYLSYSGTSYGSVASGSGFTSNMQFAVFTIPVPAPALIAGLGLAGALALRRRMK